MTQLRFGSAGVTSREIDTSGPVVQEPVGVPAGVIGTSVKGPAFVPITIGTLTDFYAKFGETDGEKFGPLAVVEWLRNARALTYVRVLGVGDGRERNEDGSVTSAGFTVGEQQPLASADGLLSANPYANGGSNSTLGRLYFLGAFMSESAGSTFFSSPKLQGAAAITPGVTSSLPVIRGILMAPSGVIPKLSSSITSSTAPTSTLVATNQSAQGSIFGAVRLLENSVAKQEFVLLLNGHKGTDTQYPNVITASFDVTAPNYLSNVLNTDPYKLQQAGHYLYAHWDVYPAVASVTGTGLVSMSHGASSATAPKSGYEVCAFLTSGSLARNVGSSTVPNYESWTDRFSTAASPWVKSQAFGGQSQNLFRIHALDAGTGIASNYKLSIENIVPSNDPVDEYGSFDLVVRDWADNDSNVRYLEQWRGLSLNPSSDRYISKVIGDVHAFYDFDQTEGEQRLFIDGVYKNKSNLIRVEVDPAVESGDAEPTALPMGVRGIKHLVTSGSAPLMSPSDTSMTVSSVLKRSIVPPLPMRLDITQGSGERLSVNPSLYWGVRFEHVTSLSTPNASTLADESLVAFSKYFPDFAASDMPFVVGDNEGAVTTSANGVVDADLFCLNGFSLENIQVVTGSNGLADPNEWVDAEYVRNGAIVTNDTTKTRAFSTDDLVQANRRFVKFSFMLQGGFDGVNIFDEDEAKITNAAVSADMNDDDRGLNDGPSVKAYLKALDVMKNTTDVDIQLLAIPGLRDPIVTDAAVAAVEDRFDAMYVMDIEQLDADGDAIVDDDTIVSVSQTVDDFRARSLDTSFAAAYFPDVVIEDPTTKTNVVTPPSVAVLGALALNDAIGHPWFAPAGFTRGSLASVQETRVKLTKNNMDQLYDVDINPLTSFPGNANVSGTNPTGNVIVWGQKTLQVAASSLDRVNVRRLLIDLRRSVRDVSRRFHFEPNRDATLARFSAAVTPVLDRVRALQGIDRFKVIIDTSTTTQADIDNNVIRGKIFVQPTKVAEFVSIDFEVTNSIAE